jgi:hypothetical protein
VPSADTSDLSQTFVGLAGELLGTPSMGDTLETMALGNTDNIDDLVLLEYGGNRDLLLEQAVGKGNLVRDTTAVDLDLHQVRFLLFETGLADLGMGEDTDDSAVTADAFKFALNALLARSLGALYRMESLQCLWSKNESMNEDAPSWRSE